MLKSKRVCCLLCLVLFLGVLTSAMTLGIRAQNYSGQILPNITGGVRVVEVMSGHLASAFLSAGDIIIGMQVLWAVPFVATPLPQQARTIITHVGGRRYRITSEAIHASVLQQIARYERSVLTPNGQSLGRILNTIREPIEFHLYVQRGSGYRLFKVKPE